MKDALGEPVSMVETKRAEPGEDLRLTLDARIQERTEEVLAEVGQTYTPKGATAIVMDPRTGEVLALANWPRVDANNVGRRARLRAPEPRGPANYEPGSTFKAFTVVGRARGEAGASPARRSTCRRRSRSPTGPSARRTTGAAGPRRSREILAESSNVGAVMIGLKLGAKRFDQWVRRFGFGRPTGIDLPGEERRHRPAAGALLGLVDGQPADRPGPRGHADADGARRTRRSPTTA